MVVYSFEQDSCTYEVEEDLRMEDTYRRLVEDFHNRDCKVAEVVDENSHAGVACEDCNLDFGP